MKNLSVFSIAIFLCGCGLRTKTLLNGQQKVATNSKVYSNKQKFEKSLLLTIDTSVIYEQYDNTFYVNNKSVNVLARLNYHNPYTYYGAYRFYSNGCFNYFILNRVDTALTQEVFDPVYNGWRGVYYKDDNKIKGDLITQVSGIGTIDKIEETFEFRRDTLFVHAKGRWNYIYLKRQVPAALISYQAEW